MKAWIFIFSVTVATMLTLPLFAEENPHAEDNLALFKEALLIQGMLTQERSVKDFDNANEMFAERSSRYPDLFSGDWVLYAPTGEAYYWEHNARFTALNQFRYKGGTNALVGYLDAYAWKHSHNSVEDTGVGFNLNETRHFTYGLTLDEAFGTGFYGKVRSHDVQRWGATPVLPDYDSLSYEFGFRKEDKCNLEWRTSLAYSLFDSEMLDMESVRELNFDGWVGWRMNNAFNFYASVGKDYHEVVMPNGSLVDNELIRNRITAGIRYESPICNAFAGASIKYFDLDESPIYTSHLTGGSKYDLHIGYRDFYYVDRIRVGYEWSDIDAVRYMYEDPAHERFLIRVPTDPADLVDLIQTETPSTDKMYANTMISVGDAQLTTGISKTQVDDTATWVGGVNWPVRSYWPDEMFDFDASLTVPFADRFTLTAYNRFRKSDNDVRLTNLKENLYSADLSFNVTPNHSVSIGYESGKWEISGPQALAIDADIQEDTWRVGFAGDYDNWDFNFNYSNTKADTNGLAQDIGDWNTLQAEVDFDELWSFLPMTIGAEWVDGNYDFNNAFDYDGWRFYLRFLYEF